MSDYLVRCLSIYIYNNCFTFQFKNIKFAKQAIYRPILELDEQKNLSD